MIHGGEGWVGGLVLGLNAAARTKPMNDFVLPEALIGVDDGEGRAGGTMKEFRLQKAVFLHAEVVLNLVVDVEKAKARQSANSQSDVDVTTTVTTTVAMDRHLTSSDGDREGGRSRLKVILEDVYVESVSAFDKNGLLRSCLMCLPHPDMGLKTAHAASRDGGNEARDFFQLPERDHSGRSVRTSAWWRQVLRSMTWSDSGFGGCPMLNRASGNRHQMYQPCCYLSKAACMLTALRLIVEISEICRNDKGSAADPTDLQQADRALDLLQISPPTAIGEHTMPSFGLLSKATDVEVRRVYRHSREPWTSAPPSPTAEVKVYPVSSASQKPSDAPYSALGNIQVEWSIDIRVLLGYEEADVRPTVAWWLDLIHPEDRDKVVSTLREHFAWSHSASTARARLWYSEYRIRLASPAQDEYLLVGDRMTTTRQQGLPILSESFMFDLKRRQTSQRHDADFDQDNFRIVTENMHSGLFM